MSDAQKQDCEGMCCEDKSGKSPRRDEIPIKISFDCMKNPSLACFNYSFETGRLSGTQQEGVIAHL